jgi:phosphoglycolate phosphatase-like HAD superfamily hydrolase
MTLSSTQSADRKLVLFDIDGTLLTSGGAGERALRLGFKDRFGIDDDYRSIEIAGRTDSLIARQIFRKHGIPETPENLTAFFDGYLHHLGDLLPQSQGRLLPGILELLEALKNRADVLLGLLTGNLQRGAELKLTHYGVWTYFKVGAYADDHHERNELGPFVCARAVEAAGCEFPADRVFVIGDTPHDIACAHAIGAKAIGVATGSFFADQLRAAGADYVFDDLSDVQSVLRILARD